MALSETRPADAEPRRQRIVRRSLHDEVADRLRDMIIEGELAPGERVTERLLCERFGISRTPLREALKVLASEGLLALTPNQGATVARITLDDVEEVFAVMGALEALSGELACARITDAEVAAIKALHYQMVAHYHRGELPEYFKLNQRIHGAILEAAGNPTLTSTCHGLARRIRQARYLANMSRDRWAQAVAEHGEMLVALEARDGEALSRILKTHLRNKCDTVKAALAGQLELAAPAGPGRDRERPAQGLG